MQPDLCEYTEDKRQRVKISLRATAGFPCVVEVFDKLGDFMVKMELFQSRLTSFSLSVT